MAMYAEVISVVNGLQFNKLGNLKNEADRAALESEIGVALGNAKDAEAKAKRLRENSIKAVRHFNYAHKKGELKFPSQATPSAILEHLQSEAVNVSTESGLASLGKVSLDKKAKILKDIFGEIVTKDKMGNENTLTSFFARACVGPDADAISDSIKSRANPDQDEEDPTNAYAHLTLKMKSDFDDSFVGS